MNSDKHQLPENEDAALSRALKNLPERTAPAALLPRVMLQAQERTDKKWHRRLSPRLTVWSGALLLALAGGLSWLCGRFYDANINPVLDHIAGACRTVFSVLVDSLLRGSFGFSEESCRFILIAFSILLPAMYITCIGLGAFVYRVVRR
jgi:hypothetical protein